MGVDEVGRGCLAGNVVAAAVVLPAVLPTSLVKLTDSKKLTEKQRLSLVRPIVRDALAYGVARLGPSTIDQINILEASLRAMHLAVTKATQRLACMPDIVLVDGNRPIRNLEFPQMTLVKGDARSFAIAAASVLAKVARDREMVIADRQFPEYGFARHKGYGTSAHRQALGQFGLSPLHRRSFKWQPPPEPGRNG